MKRDEWLRAAWRVMVGKQIDPAQLVFVDEMGAKTSACTHCTLGPPEESEHTVRCPVTVGRTPPFSSPA
jgi:hypothetical protein